MDIRTIKKADAGIPDLGPVLERPFFGERLGFEKQANPLVPEH